MATVCMALRNTETRIAIIDYSRDSVVVHRVQEEAAILPQVLNGNLRDTITFFERLTRTMKVKNAELMISYPTNIGRLDCFESDYIDPEDYNRLLPAKIFANLLIEKKEQFYVDRVMESERDKGLYITGVAVNRQIVDTLFNGAKTAGFRRITIEPEALAVIRVLNDWKNVSYILEIEENSMNITSFYPKKGITVFPQPNLGFSRLLNSSDGISTLCQQLMVVDLSTSKTFGGLERNSVNIYVTCSDDKMQHDIIRKLMTEGKSERVREFRIVDGLIKDKSNSYDLLPFIVPLGLGLKPLVERMNEDEAQVVSNSKPSSGRSFGQGTIFGKATANIPFVGNIARLLGARFGA